ncbi:MAG: undecaprenyl-phosphate glucose phosphotransferase [Pseudomonadota bacterium]
MKESSAAFSSHVMRRYMLALFDSVRVLLHLTVAGFSGWLAFILYYAPESFVPLENLFLFFDASSIHYGKLAVLGGAIFSTISFVKYGRGMSGPLDQQLQRLISAWCISLLIVIGLLFLMKTGSDYSRGWMIVWAMTTPILLIINLGVERGVVAMMHRLGFARRRLAIVGATEQAARLLESLSDNEAPDNFDLIGIFDDRVFEDPSDPFAMMVRGSLFELKQLCRKEPIDAIVIAMPSSDSRRIADTVERLMEVPADIFLGPDLAHFELTHRSGTHLGPVPVTSLTRLPMRDWAGIAKWLEDKIIVLAAAIFLAPLLLLTAVLIKLDSPGPVLFRQRRFGFNNVAFDVYKFRTMHVDKGDPTGVRQTSRHDDRITRVGRFLRKTSIDELPQLINVWIGNMSIVGPRAHPVGMMVKNQPYQEIVRHYAARHRVKPGITGLAQVNGNRGEVTTREKAEKRVHFDLFYIENWSIWLDLSIILRTAIRLPFDRSAY